MGMAGSGSNGRKIVKAIETWCQKSLRADYKPLGDGSFAAALREARESDEEFSARGKAYFEADVEATAQNVSTCDGPICSPCTARGCWNTKLSLCGDRRGLKLLLAKGGWRDEAVPLDQPGRVVGSRNSSRAWRSASTVSKVRSQRRFSFEP